MLVANHVHLKIISKSELSVSIRLIENLGINLLLAYIVFDLAKIKMKCVLHIDQHLL